MAHYDIIVVGGGLSGAAAAISASRMGKRVCLVEKYNCLGGAAAYDLVLPFMYSYTMVDGKRDQLTCGLFLEIKKRLKELGGLNESWDDCFSGEHLKLVLNRMAIESGVNLLFQAYLTDVSYKDGILYDIDIHSPDGEGTSHHYFKDGEYYQIPYRALIPRNTKNLLVTGRCIGADHEAQASLRIMPTCTALGQASGVALALCHSCGATTTELSVRELQDALLETGARID
ncbi:MAG: FAD-dependent oxidoreductase [Clostridia bacterium]|nr:FAD-dependent oxidoreductase [Clostridia bacterium]